MRVPRISQTRSERAPLGIEPFTGLAHLPGGDERGAEADAVREVLETDDGVRQGAAHQAASGAMAAA